VFPRWSLNNYQIGGSVEENARANIALTDVMMVDHVAAEGAMLNVQRKSVPLRSLVCSHDCEFDKSEIKNRMGILVAPIVAEPETDDEEAKEKLRQSASRNAEGGWDFIHLFPIELPGEGLFVADFSAMMAVGPPAGIRKRLVDMREQEMTDDLRSLLQMKLAGFFGRREEPQHEGDAAPAGHLEEGS
jgi:hypothetical protein